ncbi:MAG: hypothetical protein L0H39_04835, partial [Brachybacterium sp.]|nr:hypothetical protein [Brachybacterium sp.]
MMQAGLPRGGGPEVRVRWSGFWPGCGVQIFGWIDAAGMPSFRRTGKRSSRPPGTAPGALRTGTSQRPVYEDA